MLRNTSKIYTDVRNIMTSTFFVNVFNLARNVLVARLLGPYSTGLTMTLLTIPQVASYLNFGLPEVLPLLVPHYKGKKKDEDAARIKNKVFTFSLFIAFDSFLVVAMFVLLGRSLDVHTRIYVLLAGVIIVINSFTRFFVANLAAEKMFLKLGWVEFGYAAILLATTMLIPFCGAYGFWLGLICSHFFVVIYSAREYRQRAKLVLIRFELKKIVRLIPQGLAMMLATSVYLPFVILAKIFIAGSVGVLEVGYFSLSIIVVSLLSIIPRAVSRVMLPHMSSLNAESSDFMELFRLFKKAQLCSFGITTVAVIGGFYLMEPIVSMILPQYAGGVSAARIMLLAALPYSFIDVANNIPIVINRKRLFFVSFFVMLFLQAGAFLLFSHQGMTIYQASWSFVWVFLVYAVSINVIVCWVLLNKAEVARPY